MWQRTSAMRNGLAAAARCAQPLWFFVLLLLLPSSLRFDQAAAAAVPALPPAPTAQAAAAAAGSAVDNQAISECQLSIQGSASLALNLLRPTSSLQAPTRVILSCTGSLVTAAAHESVATSLQKTATGVRWDPGDCDSLGCLLTICGSSAVVFRGALVQSVQDRGLSAVVCVSGSSMVVFKGGSFTDIRTSQGALLALGDSSVVLEGTRVTNNTASVDVGPLAMGGGLLAQEQAHVNMTDCLFAGNRALGNVAAFGAAVAAQDQSHVVVVGGVFQQNVASAPAKAVGAAIGGALYAEGSASIEARGVKFVDNRAEGNVVAVGGALCVMHNATLKLVGCSFARNTAVSQNIGVGGALGALNHSAVHIEDGRFVGNRAFGGSLLGAGGAVLADNHASIEISSSRLLANKVSGSVVGAGGAINANVNVTLTLRRSLVSGNAVSAAGVVLGGGVACLNTSRCLVEDTVITYNNVTSSNMPAVGGGLGVMDQASVRVVRCNVSHNMVRGGLALAGGGIMTQGNDTRLTVDNCTFESNTVAANAFTGSYAAGGAIGAQGPAEVDLANLHRSYRPGTSKGFVVLRGSSFLHNTVAGVAASTGGAVFAGDGAVHITVESCRFVGNSVGGIPGFATPPLICCGGAMAVQERSVLTVAASDFESNCVEGVHTCGGAACAQNGGTMHLVTSRFVRNVAGGVSADAAVASNATGPSGVLRGGMTCGGGACATNNGSIVIDRCEFEFNLALGVSSGGGVCASITSSLMISDAAFKHNEAGGSGGAVGLGGGCTAAVTNCTFVNNTASNPETGCGGAVSIAVDSFEAEQAAACTIESCSFMGNSALGCRGSGGGVYAANADLLISSSSFSANTAQQGGALGGSGTFWDIRNSSFTNHSAPGPGGAVFAAGGLAAMITGCDISGNRGSEGGGIYAASSPSHTFNLTISDTRISSNQAQTGGGMFLKAGSTGIGSGTVISGNHASQQAGGVGWVGAQSVSCVSGAACKSVLSVSCEASISDNRAAVAGGGLFLGEAFDTDLDVVGKCVTQVVHNNSAAFGSVDVFQVSSMCKAGQVSKGGWCDECVAGTFSFDPHANGCERCPANAVCLGGSSVLPASGFWHSSNNSTQIHLCPNPLACAHTPQAIHTRQSVDGQCSTGYLGRVCGSCDEGFGFTTPFKCGHCMSFGKTVGLYMAALLCLVAFLCYSARTAFKDNLQQRTAPRASDTIKTLLLYLNYLVIFGSIRVDWPRSLSILYTVASWFLSSASGQVISLDCMLPHSGPLPLAIKRQLMYLFVPFVITMLVLLLFGGAWVCAGLCCCRRRRPDFARIAVMFPTAVLVSLYMFFPGFVRVAWGMFACLKLDDPHSALPYPQYAVATAASGYWVQDMTQACYEGWHLSWSMGLGLPCVLLFCVGVPVALFAWLAAHRHSLRAEEFQKHFGFLYADFRQDRWWWEALVAARTVLIVCIAVFASVVGPYYGVVMFVVVIHLSLALQLAVCPFAFALMQRVQLAALGSLDITGCVTLTFFMVDRHAPSCAFTAYKEIAGALLLVMHVGFLCWCLLVLLSGLSLQRVRVLASAVLARAPCSCLHHTCGSSGTGHKPRHAGETALPETTCPTEAPGQLQHSKWNKFGRSSASAGTMTGGCQGCSSPAAAAATSGSLDADAVVVSLQQHHGHGKDYPCMDTEAALDGS